MAAEKQQNKKVASRQFEGYGALHRGGCSRQFVSINWYTNEPEGMMEEGGENKQMEMMSSAEKFQEVVGDLKPIANYLITLI